MIINKMPILPKTKLVFLLDRLVYTAKDFKNERGDWNKKFSACDQQRTLRKQNSQLIYSLCRL